MRRRDLLTLFGSTAIAWPCVLRAQQKAMPVIGFLGGGSPGSQAALTTAFREGLKQTGWVEGQNVTIEYRWAGDNYDRLPALADDLVARKVDVDGLIQPSDASFNSRLDELGALASRYAISTIYDWREYPAAGGLISYGPSLAGLRRQLGIYAGKILHGAKPADLPVQEPTKFELVINLKTANALGLTGPPSILARADEVIE